MKNKQKVTGFTLIEIMLTVAIIGILSSIALPSYFNYVKKAKAREIVEVYDMFRVHLMDFYTKNGRFPTKAEGDGDTTDARNLAIGLGNRTSFETDTINRAWVTDIGAIKIEFKDNSLRGSNNNNRFTGYGEKVGGRFVWYCNVKSKKINNWFSNVDDKYLPKRCQNQ